MRIAGAGNAGALKRLKDVLVSQPFPLLSARRYPHYELLGFDVRVCTDDQALCSHVFPHLAAVAGRSSWAHG
jgi:heme oxygenase